MGSQKHAGKHWLPVHKMYATSYKNIEGISLDYYVMYRQRAKLV